jgi:threonine dehydratase
MVSALAPEVEKAAERIAPFVRETPLQPSPALSDSSGADVLLKLENLQLGGSFKLRGATNKLMSLDPVERGRGVVAASSGNHGAGVALAARALGIPAEVFVPEGASRAKVDAMRRAGTTVHFFGTDGLDTELHARAYASDRRLPYVSPYNDLAVVAGQGSVGVEIARQTSSIDALIIAVGGGGLISGTSAYLKQRHPALRVIGALPENSPVMSRSIQAGRVLEMPSLPTLSDGSAGGIEADTVTFPLCQQLVDDWVEVREDEIATAMRHCIEVEHMLIEGSAGVAVAALHRMAPELGGMRVVVVLCGANVSAERLKSVL